MSNNSTIQEIRRSNLEAQIKEYGSIAAFCEAIGKPASLLSQIRSSNRNVGEKLARDIEIALSLPSGWLDNAHEDSEDELNVALETIKNILVNNDLSKDERNLLAKYRQLSARDKDIVRGLVKLCAKS